VFQVPLGVIPKNESSNADMMDILELIQENYVPTQDIKTNEQGQENVPSDLLFFEGDQLQRSGHAIFRKQERMGELLQRDSIHT
jgi:hypothetical protein